MATFPRITSPCPYKGPLSDILDRDAVCGLCHRQVHDLSAMGERQRVAFLEACSGETCVTYRLPLRAAALAVLAAGAMTTAATAQGLPTTISPDEPEAEVTDLVFSGGIGRSEPVLLDIPVQLVSLESLEQYGSKTQADAAKQRWDETHRRLDSGKARREKD